MNKRAVITDRREGQNYLVEKFVRMFKCDTARISRPVDRMFLILGWKRHTKDQKDSFWQRSNGERFDFAFIEEKCVASGKTVRELIASARHYKSLLGKSWSDLLADNSVRARRKAVNAVLFPKL